MTMKMYFESWKYMCLRRSLAQYKYIYFLSVHFGVLPPPPQYKKLATLLASYYKWYITRKVHWLFLCMQMFNLRLRESICSTNKMMKEITALDCENVKKFKFARLARSHIRRFLSILVSCQYNDVYIAPYHKQGRRSVFRMGRGGGKS